MAAQSQSGQGACVRKLYSGCTSPPWISSLSMSIGGRDQVHGMAAWRVNLVSVAIQCCRGPAPLGRKVQPFWNSPYAGEPGACPARNPCLGPVPAVHRPIAWPLRAAEDPGCSVRCSACVRAVAAASVPALLLGRIRHEAVLGRPACKPRPVSARSQCRPRAKGGGAGSARPTPTVRARQGQSRHSASGASGRRCASGASCPTCRRSAGLRRAAGLGGRIAPLCSRLEGFLPLGSNGNPTTLTWRGAERSDNGLAGHPCLAYPAPRTPRTRTRLQDSPTAGHRCGRAAVVWFCPDTKHAAASVI